MVRSTIVILLCITYLGGTFVSFIPYLYYSMNKEYVAQNLCENKADPSMHCNGKCFIGKEIIKLNEQKEGRRSDQQHVQQNEIFPHDKTIQLGLTFFEQILLLEFDDLVNETHLTYLSAAFIPPEFLG